jgi:uncharacterized protein YfiM (DUF2279 family)
LQKYYGGRTTYAHFSDGQPLPLSVTTAGTLNIPKLFLLLHLSLLGGLPVFAQTDSAGAEPRPHPGRVRLLAAGSTTAYSATLVGLHQLWYKEQTRTGFHFFNDNAQWKQVDKAGHLYSTYHLSRLGTQALRWAGLPPGKAAVLGGVTGLVFQTPIEVLDGFSAAYGASWGDVAANMAGAALYVGQQLLWREERIHPRFSFQPTALAKLRPNMLGKNLPEQSLKDYNGQTYWLSFNVKPWLGAESRFPGWLNVSLGYGAQNMVYANDAVNRAQGFHPYRQYYLSFDVNFTRIPTRSRLLRSLFFVLNTVHVPAPALEFNRERGLVFHPLYF